MNLIGIRAPARDGARGKGPATDVALVRVDVGKGHRVELQVRRIGESSDAVEVVVGEGAAEVQGRIGARGIDTVGVVARFGEEREGIEVAPPLAHSSALLVREAERVPDEPVGETVSQFVKHHVVIEVAVPVGRRPIENEHLHPGQGSVRRCREVGVVRPRGVLRLGLHEIPAQSSAPEIVVLKISRRLGETERVESVVVPVRPEEEVRDGPHTVSRPSRRIAPARRRVVGECEIATARTRPAGHPGGATVRVDAIGAVDVEPRIDVIARRNARAIWNPAQVVEARQLAHQAQPCPRRGGPLNAAAGCRVRWRQWRRAVARIDVERGCLGLILRNVFPEEHLTARVVDDHVIGRDGLPEQHPPRQHTLGRPEGEDDQLDGDVVRKRPTLEAMPQPVAASLDQRRDRAKTYSDVVGRDLDRQFR